MGAGRKQNVKAGRKPLMRAEPTANHKGRASAMNGGRGEAVVSMADWNDAVFIFLCGWESRKTALLHRSGGGTADG